jgi:hypothetical protein
MADYSRQDATYARDIMRRLMSGEADKLELRPDFAISDVESHANMFTAELDLLRGFGANVPAVIIEEEAVPVSLDLAITGGADRTFLASPLGLNARSWRRNRFIYEFAYEFFHRLRDKRPIDGIASMKPEEARRTFVRRATKFVATRLASVRRFRDDGPNTPWRGQAASMLNIRQRVGGPRIGTPGCNFTVSTNSNGLRVFWSGAYYVTPNNFNHPTSPTSSVLQSGTYVFGVDGGAYGNVIQWDLSAVASLPGLPSVHLNF